MNDLDNYKLATPPDQPWICEDCGAEVPEYEIERIPTANRYVTVNLCPHCAGEYYDRLRYTEELIKEELA